jgi:dolichol-phosphate mannosyltransferase
MLVRPGPWLALAVAIACTSPVLWWNAQHDWASFRFQFARRIASHDAFVPGRTLEWLGAQLGLLSPLIFVLFTAAWFTALRRFRRDAVGRWRFAACFAIPWLAVCVWHGLFTWVNINWPLPAYLSLIPVSIILLRGAGPLWRRRFAAHQRRRLTRGYAAALVAVISIALVFVSSRSARVPRWDAFAPWDRLGAAAEVVEVAFAAETGGEPFIVTQGQYKLASELAFYMREEYAARDWADIVPARVVFGGGLNYVHWQSLENLLGRDAIYIGEDVAPRELAGLQACFREVSAPQEFFSRRRGLGAQQTYSVVRCREFRGVPPGLAEP